MAIKATPRGGRHGHASPRRDRGSTFIELLIAIVLLGTAVVATLTAVRASVIGSTFERDHSKAHEWLQSASEVLTNDVVWLDCGTTVSGADIANTYESALQAVPAIAPEDWMTPQIEIPSDVLFAAPAGTYGATCYGPIDRQLITIRVKDPDGVIIETVEVVKAP